MAGYYDVYCLGPSRTAEAIARFLDQFAPAREESAIEYTVPQYADEAVRVFAAADQVISYCVNQPAEPHGIYWRCLNEGDPIHAMVFFTPDRAVIFGLSVSENAHEWLEKLKVSTTATAGWMAFETPPPTSASEFLRLAKQFIKSPDQLPE